MPEAALTTPLLEQYEAVRARYPGHLVLFRVGDFYEAFGEEAKLLARELEITLTARGADARGERVPMAGVPYHAVDSYLARLLQKGYRVAVCDQVEDARLAKGLVKREVTRVVTPGTVVEERVLPGPDHNFLALLDPTHDPGAYAVVDVTTGEWYHDRADGPGDAGLLAALAALGAREVLVPEGPRAAALTAAVRAEMPGARVDQAPPPLATDRLPAALVGAASDAAVATADARLAAYVAATAPRLLPHVVPLPRVPGGRRMRLDARTLRHLEIVRPMDPDDARAPTLLGAWNVARSAPGHRTLAYWLRNPLADPAAIRARQDAVAALVERAAELDALRDRIASIGDLGRIAGRLAGRRLRPAELYALRDGLASARDLAEALGPVEGLPATLAALAPALRGASAALSLLETALPAEAPPPGGSELGRFRRGFAPEVDAPRDAEAEALRALDELERAEQSATGIRTLKIGYNQVFGYYFEVSRANLARVPAHFRRKQTLAGGERFLSDALAELEQRVLTARESAERAEAAAWERFLATLDGEVPSLHRASRALGELDVLAGFASEAQRRGLVRPEVDDGSRILIRDARHPVLDAILGSRFVPNDIDLDTAEVRLLVLTGPNMSGKSTYMRTLGLLVVLAQAGAFLPARYARIGVVDALHTRMGFTDAIGRGKSSFLVEMSEVAEILRDATPRSLVLLDEVGRGTSTFDGLALAWAILRYLHDRAGCRTILATHYHQLTELIEALPGARNAHLAIREDGDAVVFLHRVVPGSTDRSFGLHVARVAGLPKEVLDEARRTLKRLEAEGIPAGALDRRGARAGPRFTQAVLLGGEERPPSAVEAALRAADPNAMSPLDAHRWIVEQRRRLVEGAPGPGVP